MMRLRVVMLSCLLALAGCLAGSYNDAHSKSLTRYREAVELQRLHREPKVLAGGRLRVQVPKLFTAEIADKPPLLDDLPGFCVTLQELLAAGGGGEKMPVTLSVWAPADEAGGLEDVKKRISDKIKALKDPAFTAAAWGTVDIPQAKPSSWAVMTAQGQQPFERLAAGEKGVRETKSTEGTTKVWLGADPDSKVCTVLMWRVPQELAAAVSLDDLAALVARTVRMSPAEQPAAPAADAPDAKEDAKDAKKADAAK
jgi:hypothetical protein